MEYDSDSSSGTISAHRKSPRNISLKRSARSSETSSHLPVNPFPPQLPPVPIAHQNGSPRPYNPASLMPPGASNVPPMTMIMPVPVPVPMPVPIPLPLPITMEKIMEVFDKNKDKTESSVADGTIKTKADCNGLDSRHPLNGRDMKNDINENDINRDLQHVKDERSDFRKSFRHEDTYSDSCEEAIDLSRNSGDKTRQKADDIRLNGAEKLDESTSSAEDEGGIKVPKIHIISPRAEPPLSQQLPLPPIDPKFASRRGLILDAPGVPKRQRSPSPDRRSYARTVPRDVMEAARRRCLRARVRTK
ncbi:hypothetical protein FSP39_015662 [Pinctada imbricata]|uniref:Uncharacterized protein n=1 Tax=Pinctada imbricata TaxID=66713 RepID=A0AA88YF99_PINIB|nr:hypothetical protein FSP39_015662 [Pinctada imbricata]